MELTANSRFQKSVTKVVCASYLYLHGQLMSEEKPSGTAQGRPGLRVGGGGEGYGLYCIPIWLLDNPNEHHVQGRFSIDSTGKKPCPSEDGFYTRLYKNNRTQTTNFHDVVTFYQLLAWLVGFSQKFVLGQKFKWCDSPSKKGLDKESNAWISWDQELLLGARIDNR